MYFGRPQKDKRGFTIVELVIVIAVIAILAAVLVPTFSGVINSAKRSRDTEAVAHMNVALETYAIIDGRPEDYDGLKAALSQGGYPLPKTTDSRDSDFYWIPDENRVVLFDEKHSEILFPKELMIYEKDDKWISLSKGKPAPEPESEPEPTSDPEEEPQKIYTLPNGDTFNNIIKPLAPTKIIFGNTSDYPDKVSETFVSVTEDGGIKAYQSGSTVYVLCDGSMKLPADASKMFSGMTELTEIQFGTLDTSDTTNMHNMFYNCGKLKKLDISMFNTAKVTNMEKMFADCFELSLIDVTTGQANWNISAVKNGDAMFDNCKKLKNYTTDTGIAFIDFLIDKFFVPGLDYANTGSKGFLTEK